MTRLRTCGVVALAHLLLGAPAISGQEIDRPLQLADRGPMFFAIPAPGSVPVDARNAEVFSRQIAVDLSDMPVADALSTIARVAQVEILFADATISPARRVTLRATAVTLGGALSDVLLGAGVDVELTGGGVLTLVNRASLVGVAPPEAQRQATGTITARVTDAGTDRPLAGAAIKVEGTRYGGLTTTSGIVTIGNVPAGTYDVTARLLGYKPSRITSLSVVADSTARITFRLAPSAAVLEHVQVTATKSPVSVGDVPALTSSVSNQQIEQRGDTRLTQALANVPGLINSALEGQFESVTLRGMPRTAQEWTSTLLLIDGVPQTNSSNSARVINLPLNEVNNIEVARGPNSALYGRTAIGGVVNVLTPSPAADPVFNGDLGGGQFDLLQIKAAASGPIKDWGGYYLSAGANQNHGFYHQPYTFTIKDNDLFAKLAFSPDSKSDGALSINNTVSDNAVPTRLPIIDGKLLSDIDPRVSVFRNYNLPSSNYHQDEFRTAANYQRELASWLTGTGILSYRHIVYNFQNDGDIAGAPFDTAAHTFTQYPFEEVQSENIYYSEARLAFRPTLGTIDNELLVGASYDYTSGNVNGNLIYTDTTTFGWTLNYLNPVFPNRSSWLFLPFGGNRYSVGIVGAYGQYRITPIRRLIVTLGERYDDAHLTNLLSATKPKLVSDFHAFSPKISATVRLLGIDSTKPRPVQLNAYVTYSGAFVPPRTPSALNLSDSVNLQPSHIRNYEGGLKGDITEARISFDAGYFQMRQDGIVVETRVGPFFFPSNAGVETFRGFEGSLQWAPLPSASVYGNVALYHNRFGNFVIEQSTGSTTLTGNRLPISPDVVLNGGGTWQIWKGLGTTLNVKHVGSVFVDQGNTFLFSPYTVAEASIFWTRGSVLVTVAAQNLFDARYFTMGDINAGQSANPAPPRQIVIGTHFRFR